MCVLRQTGRSVITVCVLNMMFSWWAIAGESFVFAAENSWPPFANADGTGISRNIVEQALAFSGSSAEFVVVPYARALRMAENGQVDGVFNVTKQNNTTELFAFGDEPLFQAPASFYYPPGSLLDYAAVEEIPNGLVIALITGYEYGDKFEAQRNRFREIRVATQEKIISLLQYNKVDLAIMFDDVASATLASMGLDRHVIRKGQLNHVSDIYVAFSRSTPNLEQKIAVFDDGLRRLKAQATPE